MERVIKEKKKDKKHLQNKVDIKTRINDLRRRYEITRKYQEEARERGVMRQREENGLHPVLVNQSGSCQNPIEIMDVDDVTEENIPNEHQSVGFEIQGQPRWIVPYVPINESFEAIQARASELINSHLPQFVYPPEYLQYRADDMKLEQMQNTVKIRAVNGLMSGLGEIKHTLEQRNIYLDVELGSAASHGLYPQIVLPTNQSDASPTDLD